MDPKLLRAFLYAAEEGSIAGAARRLGLSPNAVSSRIRTLERRLGVRLLRRSARGVGLAASGAGFAAAAREIVEMNDRLLERARSRCQPRPGGPPPAMLSAGPKSPL